MKNRRLPISYVSLRKPLTLFLGFACSIMATAQEHTVIFPRKEAMTVTEWKTVNDGVMGGVSSSFIKPSKSGTLLFYGEVRLENNGGFASARYPLSPITLTGQKALCLRLKGDGKQYQFRIKEEHGQRHSYSQPFKTNGEWQTIRLPFSDFRPQFRGKRLDMPNFPADKIAEVAILIGNKKQQVFTLEIARITLDES